MLGKSASKRPHLLVKQGFTLIELLVVIAIIALLAAILFPVFARARENARKSSCANNLKQIGLAAYQYSQDYDELVVSSYGAYTAPGVGGTVYWMGLILPYIKNTQVYQCPSATKFVETNPQNPQSSTYAHQHNNIGWGMPTPSLADFGSTSGTLIFTDVGRYNVGGGSEWDNLKNGSESFTTSTSMYSRNYTQCKTCPGTPGCCDDATTVVPRHLGTCNVAFLDGHVKAMKISTLTVPFFNAAARGGPDDFWDRN